MNWARSGRDKQRYYLLAGMGGRAARRKHYLFVAMALATGVVVSLGLALTLYLADHGFH
jgi:hypothetical protein